jgi:hypothetical protein
VSDPITTQKLGNDGQHNIAVVPPKPAARKGPRPSAETIRKRVTYLIGSGNVRELDEAGYVVVPASLLTEFAAFAPAQLASNGSEDSEQ